jgi:dihydropteroate synthase
VTDLPKFAVMGIVNVTPDSFSDGGRYLEPSAAVEQGLRLVAAGAALLDVGGESTRPGAVAVAAQEEIDRVVPVVEALAAEVEVAVSVDTTKAAVADAALRAGACVVNDVSAGRFDPDLLGVVTRHDAGFVAMHMRGEPRTMQDDPHYDDVVAEVGDHLHERVDAARAAGVRADAMLVDPGIGFGKTVAHNLSLLGAITELAERAGAPLLLGTSRKSFLGRILGGASVDEREEATLATTVWAFVSGVRVVRVHDVEQSARAARLLDVLERATPEGLAA